MLHHKPKSKSSDSLLLEAFRFVNENGTISKRKIDANVVNRRIPLIPQNFGFPNGQYMPPNLVFPNGPPLQHGHPHRHHHGLPYQQYIPLILPPRQNNLSFIEKQCIDLGYTRNDDFSGYNGVVNPPLNKTFVPQAPVLLKRKTVLRVHPEYPVPVAPQTSPKQSPPRQSQSNRSPPKQSKSNRSPPKTSQSNSSPKQSSPKTSQSNRSSPKTLQSRQPIVLPVRSPRPNFVRVQTNTRRSIMT